MTYIAGGTSGREVAAGEKGSEAAGGMKAAGGQAGYGEIESTLIRSDHISSGPVQGDGRTRVYGNPLDLANARKYMRPDRYVFIESTASGELPGEGDIVLGSAPARAGAMRIAGKTTAETEKAIWDTMVSLGANWVDNDAGLSTLYITGDIPELHREPGMGEDFTAYPGNRRYTPEEWLEKFKLLSEGAEESE